MRPHNGDLLTEIIGRISKPPSEISLNPKGIVMDFDDNKRSLLFQGETLDSRIFDIISNQKVK